MSHAVRLRLRRKTQEIKNRVASIGAGVAENIHLSIKAVRLRDPEIGRIVVEADRHIDTLEVDLEKQCLEILALHQPVATDLRVVIGILNANQDLERVGDMAANIGRIAIDLAAEKLIRIPEDYFLMAEETVSMLNKSLDSLIQLDTSLACEVIAEDDRIDLKKHRLHQEYEEELHRHPENVRALTHLFLISRHLERVADHATNIAEDVIYMMTGHINRHERQERSCR